MGVPARTSRETKRKTTSGEMSRPAPFASGRHGHLKAGAVGAADSDRGKARRRRTLVEPSGRAADQRPTLHFDTLPDVSDKHVYLITGRVHPERYGLTIPEQVVEFVMGEMRGVMSITVSMSQIAVRVVADRAFDAPTLRNSSQALVGAMVDAAGWTMGCAFSVELNMVTSDHETVAFGVSLPAIAISADQQGEFRTFLALVCAPDPKMTMPLRRALADLRQAILDVFNAPFHCFRAVEGLSYAFDRNPRRGMPKLCFALHIDEDWVRRKLEIPAGEIRHGGLRDVPGPERDAAVLGAREVVKRFVALRSRGLHVLPAEEFVVFGTEVPPPDGGTEAG